MEYTESNIREIFTVTGFLKKIGDDPKPKGVSSAIGYITAEDLDGVLKLGICRLSTSGEVFFTPEE
jgi:hypothetical protein